MEWLKDWALPLSAGATFMLAIVAVWSILYTGYIRRKDIDNNFKARILEEIRLWAFEARKILINDTNWDHLFGPTEYDTQKNLETIFIPNLTITRSAEWLDAQLNLKGDFKDSVKHTFDSLRLCISILKGEEKERMRLREDDKTNLGASLRLILEKTFDIKAKHKL